MFTDTHFHLGKDSYSNPQEVLAKARENGVHLFIVSGCNRQEIEEVLPLADQNEDVYLTVGFHPDQTDKVTDEDFTYLKSILDNPKVIGIGEIGLDYHYGKENRDRQIELFRKQLALAEEKELPVVIHTREAIQDTYDIVKEFKVRGVLHCFSESYEMAQLFLKKDFYFGLGGVLTFKNSRLYEVVDKLPIDHLLLETDSPYLAPDPYRGQKNGPWNIPVIAQKLATIKNVSLKDVEKITYENTCQLFDLTKKM